jgi:hypothetical protein
MLWTKTSTLSDLGNLFVFMFFTSYSAYDKPGQPPDDLLVFYLYSGAGTIVVVIVVVVVARNEHLDLVGHHLPGSLRNAFDDHVVSSLSQ